MKQTEISKDSFQNLYSELPHGAVGQVAERAGVTTQAVRDVLKYGKYNNERVVEEAVKLVSAVKKHRRTLERKIRQTLNHESD